jgi:NAD(P)-dependent dehydrogenase (short-subunit alcohol dehydrogenase family)
MREPPVAIPELDLTTRVAVVTGGGRSIGRAIASALADAGADVLVAGRNEDILNEVASDLAGSTGRRIVPAVCDVSDPLEVDRMLAKCCEQLGPPDVLVANAGIFQTWQPSEELSLNEWDEVCNVDLRGVWICSVAAGRMMLQRGTGSIVTISSIAGLGGLPGVVSYTASKAGVVALTKTLAAEWSGRGVRVNCVAPGFIERDVEPLKTDAAALDRICSRTPLKRFGTPREVALAVLFLASNAGSFITGTTLAVDGGWLAT